MTIEVIIGICLAMCLFGGLVYYIHKTEESFDELAEASLRNQRALRERCENIEDRVEKLEKASNPKEKK